MSFIWNELLYRPLLNLLIFIYNVIPGHDLGIAIIILTIIIRFIILPFSLKSSRAQRKMKKLTPELNKLKEQHKDDQQALAKAQMDFYKQNGANPMSSCLPILIQLPIIFALYGVLREGLGDIDPTKIYSFIHLPEHINTVFLGILDLSQPDKIALPLMAGLSQYVLSVMTISSAKKGEKASPEQAMSKQMTFMLPLMTVFFAMSFPAGLALYWVATTLFGIGQQIYVDREKNKEVTVKIKKAGEDEVIEGELIE